MKKQLLALTIATWGLVLHTQAQENKFAFFQVETTNYLHLEEYKPNTTLETYSTPQGGVRLGEIVIAPSGTAQQMFEEKNTPAFLLNRKSIVNPSGNNSVQHLNAKEFIAKNVQLSLIGTQVSIEWDAQILADNEIEFQILRQEHGGASKLIKSFKGITGIDFNHYSFAETFNNEQEYQFQIMSNGKKLRYASGNLNFVNATTEIKVYPTVFSNQIFVSLSNSKEPATYLLSDVNGRIVRKGDLSEVHQTISNLENLPKGNFIMQVNHGIEKQSFKLVKE